MIVKLVKPVPMIDRVMAPGDMIDGDMLLKRLVAEGRAIVIENSSAKPTPAPVKEPVAPVEVAAEKVEPQAEKPVRASSRKKAASKE